MNWLVRPLALGAAVAVAAMLLVHSPAPTPPAPHPWTYPTGSATQGASGNSFACNALPDAGWPMRNATAAPDDAAPTDLLVVDLAPSACAPQAWPPAAAACACPALAWLTPHVAVVRAIPAAPACAHVGALNASADPAERAC